MGNPDILLMVSDEVLVFDNLSGTIRLVVNADPAVRPTPTTSHSSASTMRWSNVCANRCRRCPRWRWMAPIQRHWSSRLSQTSPSRCTKPVRWVK